MADNEELKRMVRSFRVSELSELLGFAGRNKTGKKEQLLVRALDLLRFRSAPIEIKIQELHKRRFTLAGMLANAIPEQGAKIVLPNDASSPAKKHHNPNDDTEYELGDTSEGSSESEPSSDKKISLTSNPVYPVHPDVRLKPLPFYDILSVLVAPSSLIPHDCSLFQEKSFLFHLTPKQVQDIERSKRFSGKVWEFMKQIQLRFCLLETSCEQEDYFPLNLMVKVNEKACRIPTPASTHPDAEPKRLSRPLNITNISELHAAVKNTVTVSWTLEPSRSYAIAINLVEKLDSAILLSRLRAKGIRNKNHTVAMIQERMTFNPDSEIVTTSLRSSLICPLEKRKMTEPCRATTCVNHLQCFEAKAYIQMNESKTKWVCPICDMRASFENLAIDGLFLEITAKTPSSVHEVQFREDGSWIPVRPENEDMLTIKDDTTSVIGSVTKKQKKTHEIVDLLSDSDDDEDDDEESSSSNMATRVPYRPVPVTEDTSKTYNMSFSSGPFCTTTSSACAPMISPPVLPFGNVSPISHPSVIVGNPKAISASASSPSTQTTYMLQQQVPSSSSRVQDPLAFNPWLNAKSASAYSFPSTSSSSCHYASPYTIPTEFGGGASAAAPYAGDERQNFELLNLFSGSDAGPPPPTAHNGNGEETNPDFILLE